MKTNSAWLQFKNSTDNPSAIYLEGQKRPKGVYTEIPEGFGNKSIFINMAPNIKPSDKRAAWLDIQTNLPIGQSNPQVDQDIAAMQQAQSGLSLQENGMAPQPMSDAFALELLQHAADRTGQSKVFKNLQGDVTIINPTAGQ